MVSIDNIECLNKNEDSKEYYIETTLRIEYNLKDGGNISEIINAGIQVEKLEDVVFSVEDVYRINEDEDESET